MKRKFLTVIAFVLAFTVVGSLFGCSTKVPNYDAYKDSKYLNIGAWNGPPNNYTTEEDYKDIADSGLNFIIDINSGAVASKLDCAQSAGIKYMMNGVFLDKYDGISEYAKHPAFMGIIGRDEPNVSAFADLAVKQQDYYKLYNDSLYFVNMLPCYATSEQLGTKYYTDYVSQFNNTIKPKVLVYDGYSLLKSSTGETSIESGMLFNLETVAVEAQKTGVPYWAFLQTMGFGGSHRNVNEVDVRFQYYTYLAYGYSGLLHFCYWTPGGPEFPDGVYAMIDRNGEKTEAYYGVQAVNEEVLAFDHVLLSYKWTGTMPILGENELLCRAFSRLSSPLKSHEAISEVTAEKNAIIGTFNDGTYDGFMLVNFTDPGTMTKNEVTITFEKAKKALVYVDGKPEVVRLKNHKYTANLDAGEGRFIIPL